MAPRKLKAGEIAAGAMATCRVSSRKVKRPAQPTNFCYDYPRPAVAVDLVVTRIVAAGRVKSRQVLLIQRLKEPFAASWALPGGFLEMEETLEQAAAREVWEETAVECRKLTPVGAFSRVDRDPRGRVISFAFWSEVPSRTEHHAGDDAAAAQWFPVSKLPRLAFDHAEIVAAARGHWKSR